MLTVSRAGANRVARLVAGSLLLLPALLAFGLVYGLPALRTPLLSLQAAFLGRPGRFVGPANYVWLARDPGLARTLAYTLLAALVRALAATAPAALVAWAWRREGREVRLAGRLAAMVGLALSAPAGLGLLWRLALPRVPWLRGGSALGLEFVAFLGLGGGLAVTGLLIARPGHAVRAVLVLAALAGLASGLDTFALPFAAATGVGVPAGLAPYLFQMAFLQRHLGRAAAAAFPLLLASLALGLAFGLVTERLGLCLVPAAPREERRSWPHRLAGGAALGLLLLPPALLYLWGAGMACLYPGRPLARAASELEVGLALLNGNLAPVLAILLFQLPVAYLAALSLTVVRPFGARGSRLAFVGLLASSFVPAVVVGMGLLDVVEGAGLANTPPGAALPLVAGPAALYVYRLFLAGRVPLFEQALRTGEGAGAAFSRHILRPSLAVTPLAGAAALLVAGQSFLWPLLAVASHDFLPLSLQVLASQALLATDPPALAAGAWLALTAWGLGTLLLWWPLQSLLLERLELAAGPSGASS